MSSEKSGGLIDVLHRRFFYRDSLRSVLKLLFLSFGANIVLGLALIVAIKGATNVQHKYFATDNNGKITQIVPLDNPYLTVTKVLSWSSLAAQSIYNYDFLKYKEQLNSNRKNFTEAGWAGFVKALTDSKVLDMVSADRMIVSATPAGSAIIADEGMSNGAKIWKIRVPLSVSYQGPKKIINKDIMATMIVTRVSLLDSESGIAINSIILAEANFREGK